MMNYNIYGFENHGNLTYFEILKESSAWNMCCSKPLLKT